MGALALKAQKHGSSRFTRSKVIKSVGALVLSAQTVWSSRFKSLKVWELSLYARKSVGALALIAQNVWELLL